MLIQKNYSKNNYIKSILIVWIFLSALILHSITCLNAQSSDISENKIQINFEDKLALHVDQISKNFLSDMANKEKVLLQMIQSISIETKKRGKRIVLNNEDGYEEIFGESDKLIAEYSRELENIIQIIGEIKQLEKVVEQTSDLNSWETLSTLKYQMIGLLENRELYKRGIHTQSRVSDMFKDYYGEIDSVVSMYKRLTKLERQVKARGDLKMLEEIESQKEKIRFLLGQIQSPISDSLVNQYIEEVTKVINVLEEIDDLEVKAISENSEYSLEIEAVRRSILQQVDKQLLKLFGYDSYLAKEGPTVSEIFKEWKANQIAIFNVRFSQYKIMKKSLLESGDTEARARMLERDLKDAFSDYVDENYDLAELQFNIILEDYGDYYETLELVLFYCAESYYARGLYGDAVDYYEKLLNQYSNSSYFGDSLARLLLIHKKLDNRKEFYKYFEIVKSSANNLDGSCYNRCNLLAGYVYFKDSNFDLAQEALSNVSKDSKFFLRARYLLGIVYANLNNYNDAIEIFEDLASLENYLWTEPQATFIRNYSLLKLGYVHYELGEYEEALNYFNSVSPGFSEYDKSLLGAAWTNFKKGNYEQTVEKVNLLFKDYFASSSTYEALVLSAHCKRILNQRDSALRDLRYVANARSVLELTNQHNVERKFILAQLEEIDRIEEEALERRDKVLYKVTSQIRDRIYNMLTQFQHRSTTGSLILENFQDERKAIFKQIEELDEIIALADAEGEKDIVNDAYYQRERLVKTLDTYQADQNIHNIRYFLVYPLAAKEGVLNYRKSILSDLSREIDNERESIQQNLANVKALHGINDLSGYNLDARLDLELLEEDLSNLNNRTSRFRVWLANNEIQEINTGFDRWADFSGFGMSNITFQSLEDRDKRISELAFNINSINTLFRERKKALEEKVAKFDEEVKRMEEELMKEQMEIEKLEKDKYFKELYFDKSELETEGQGRSDKQSEESERD